MNRACFMAATAAALLLSCNISMAAVATASASTTLQFTLVDLDANDGITPWIDFFGGGSSVTGAIATDSDVTFLQPPNGIGFPSQQVFSITLPASTKATSAASGDPSSFTLQTSASSGLAHGGSYITSFEFSQFTVSPNTELVLSGNVTQSAVTTDVFRSVTADTWISLSGMDAHFISIASFGDPLSGGTSGPVYLRFSNFTGSTSTGQFIENEVVIVGATNIPEPSQALLFLAALPLLFRMHRARG